MDMTEKEIAALYEKMRYPERTVRCPRCGAKLEADIRKTGARVKCPTLGCIQLSIRGI